MFARRALITAAILSAGCTPPVEYPPPPQKEVPDGMEVALESRVLRMADPNLAQRILQDVIGGDSNSQWRWTNQHPRLKMRLEPEPWIYHVGFTVPEAVLNAVGPVTLTFVVNGRTVGRQRYAEDGHFEFDAALSDEILRLADPVVFGFDVAPVLIAKDDGAKLGVLLEAIGFRKAKR